MTLQARRESYVLALATVLKCKVTSYAPHRVVVSMFGARVVENDGPCYARPLEWTASLFTDDRFAKKFQGVPQEAMSKPEREEKRPRSDAFVETNRRPELWTTCRLQRFILIPCNSNRTPRRLSGDDFTINKVAAHKPAVSSVTKDAVQQLLCRMWLGLMLIQ